MNALTHHLRFLRPLRSLLLIAIFTGQAAFLAKIFLRLDSAAVQLSACLVDLSILVGLFIAGAAHEPLHRPFALLLPGLRLRQLRFAALAIGVAALAATGIAHWAVPTLSPAAALGLIQAWGFFTWTHPPGTVWLAILWRPCEQKWMRTCSTG